MILPWGSGRFRGERTKEEFTHETVRKSPQYERKTRRMLIGNYSKYGRWEKQTISYNAHLSTEMKTEIGHCIERCRSCCDLDKSSFAGVQ